MLITREAQVIKKYETGKRVCEIKRFKRTELNYILITHYTFIKKMKLDFTQPIQKAVLQEKWTMENELPMFDIVNVEGIVSNISVF